MPLRRRRGLVTYRGVVRAQNLRKLQSANTGIAKSFDYILDTAYGRRGSLKWEILDVGFYPARTS